LEEFEIPRLALFADELVHFEHATYFAPTFIAELKKEIPLAVGHAKKDFDWDSIKPTNQYETRSQRKIKRRKLQEDHLFDWKDDPPGERACRIWEWWRLRLRDSPKFPCFTLALRLVGLSQVSSCSVERVFSRLKLIRDTCGGNMMEV